MTPTVRGLIARVRFRPLPWSDVSPVVQALVIGGAWTVTCVASLARHLLDAGESLPFAERLRLLGYWFLCYAPWALATPVVARAIVRFPLRGPRWLRHALAHVAFGLPIVYVVTVLGRVLSGLGGFVTWSAASLRVPPGDFFLECLVYAGVVGVLEGLARGAEARRRERDLADLQVRQLELENDLRDAQLEALRMKLNPHFLFNALQTVTALMRVDALAAERMLSRLGDVLRMALRLDLACEIPLSDELDVARAYLDLERIRFRDRLSVAIDVDSALCTALVPSLILQPVVENAIRHGVGRLRRPADLRIEARRTDGHLLIRVQDNGVGFVEAADGSIAPGIGLGVLRSRLEKLYPGEGGCLIQNRPEGGAEVEIRLPYHTTPLAAVSAS